MGADEVVHVGDMLFVDGGCRGRVVTGIGWHPWGVWAFSLNHGERVVVATQVDSVMHVGECS